jgi:hypothetical protein
LLERISYVNIIQTVFSNRRKKEMVAIIDLRSPILSIIRGGAQTIDDAIAMARAAVKEEITAIIATPRHKNGKYTSPKSSVIAAISQFNEKLQNCGAPLGGTKKSAFMATYCKVRSKINCCF